jgi:hypothetical protein
LEIANFPVSARTVSLLTGENLVFSLEGGALKISMPAQPPDPDISVIAVDFDVALPALSQYSPPKTARISPQQFLKTQMTANFIINAVINGLIAFSSYRLRPQIPFAEAAVDILISVAIISFLVSWFAVGTARNEIIKGNIALPAGTRRFIKLPKGPASRAWLVTLVCVLVWGGLVLDGLLYLIAPAGISGWVYILFKTLYTGASAALADLLVILSVFDEQIS